MGAPSFIQAQTARGWTPPDPHADLSHAEKVLAARHVWNRPPVALPGDQAGYDAKYRGLVRWFEPPARRFARYFTAAAIGTFLALWVLNTCLGAML